MYSKPTSLEALFNLIEEEKYDKINDANLKLLNDIVMGWWANRNHSHRIVLPKSVLQ
ncbi:hypothetical protein [Okeania hirsuta]|uniref:hypothetical protein n=1 Tax=Okeania hirsuta TaxID=1458930 RepID=UPI001374C022|nr:hypothetical protein [Okeania hirsuta]